jgi:hypothetical protein
MAADGHQQHRPKPFALRYRHDFASRFIGEKLGSPGRERPHNLPFSVNPHHNLNMQSIISILSDPTCSMPSQAMSTLMMMLSGTPGCKRALSAMPLLGLNRSLT